MGHEAWSCDLLPAQDGEDYWHIQGDIFEVLKKAWRYYDLAIFHPTCTYLTSSAEWAFKDPDYERYPGVGYHQKVKPETLTGEARREARAKAVSECIALATCGIPKIAIENPKGALSKAWRKPDQTIQPYQFGDDASKATCLWLVGLPPLVIDPAQRLQGRQVLHNGKLVERWGNQTDSGQNRLTPSANRWAERSDTYPGIARAFAENWG